QRRTRARGLRRCARPGWQDDRRSGDEEASRRAPQPGAAAMTKRTLRETCLAERRRKVAARLRELGLDGIIAYGSGRHSFLASNPAWYLTGFRQIGPHMTILLPVEGEAAVIVTPAWDRRRLAEQVGIDALFAVEPDAFLETLRREIVRLGLASKRLAVA